MFKHTATLTLVLILAASLSGQKMKFKKGDILVDNVPTFKFEKTSAKGEAFAYAMTDLKGDTLLKFRDQKMVYTQLPYEKETRSSGKYCLVEAPGLGVDPAPIYRITLAYGKRFMYDAKKTEFITPSGLDAAKWEDFLKYNGTEDFASKFAEVAAANAVRAENATASQEKYGEFSPRGGGDVYRRDDKVIVASVTVGKMTKTIGQRKDNLAYFINSTKGEEGIIATIYQKPGSPTYSVKTSIDMKSVEFKIHSSLTDATAEPYLKGLNYLVNYGYM